jgi:hypothetical protein
MPDIHLMLDPDTGDWPAATGLKPGKSYTIILEMEEEEAKGGFRLRFCTDRHETVASADITVKAGDEELFSGTVDDGHLEVSDISIVKLSFECTYNGATVKGAIGWTAGEPPFPEQIITLPVSVSQSQNQGNS